MKKLTPKGRQSLIVFLVDGEKGAEVVRLIHEQWKRKKETSR